MKFANSELVITKDGSFSFFSNDFKQSYHSLSGAMTETEYVFIKNGIEYYLDNNLKSIQTIKKYNIRILEIGSGSFLNLFQTIKFVCDSDLISNNISIEYVGLEPYPINETMLIDAYSNNNKSSEKLPQIELIKSIINSEWEKSHKIEMNNMKLYYSKLNVTFEDYLENILVDTNCNKKENFNEEFFDVIYFDAFSKSKQSNLWDYKYLELLEKIMSDNSIFVTYASNSNLKKDLRSLNMELHILKGALGKREMLRAKKIK